MLIYVPIPKGQGKYCCLFKRGGSVVVDFLFIFTPIVGVCSCSIFCCALFCVHSSIAIILIGKRELVALLGLSSWCIVVVGWLFLVVRWGCLRFVIVVFPDHTHLLFLVWVLSLSWSALALEFALALAFASWSASHFYLVTLLVY